MRSGGKASASWRLLLLATAVMLWSAVVRADDKPKMSVTPFENPLRNLQYFEDSDVVLAFDDELFESTVYRSTDAGSTWKAISDIPKGDAALLIMHRFESSTAYVLTDGWDHYKTTDRGETWSTFSSEVVATYFLSEILVFHADDPDRVIFNGMICEGIFCTELAMYTKDAFKTVHLLRDFTAGCWWARSSQEFTTGDEDKDEDRTMCIVPDPLSMFNEDQRLHISDSYFTIANDEIDEFEPDLDGQGSVDGVVNLAVVKGYILVASSSANSDEMTLYVSNDTLKWHKAMFPKDDNHDHSHHITQAAYTVLESTNHSIQIDVMTTQPSNPMGVLFTSNSDGFYFIENVPYTNRNERGHVDFEQIAGIQGVYLVNTVDNGAKVDNDGAEKQVVSWITYDEGRSFQPIMTSDGNDKIHLHSETELDNVGRVFSSPAPGLVMGNGNTGDYLNSFAKADLFVSDDAGLTWSKALDGPHKYEFGDSGSILVAIKDSIDFDVSKFSYSLNHGKDWSSVELPDNLSIRPSAITTTQDSTSLKFIIVGSTEEEGQQIIAVDFEGLDKRTCKSDDMEDWHARVDEDGKATCVMGHKQTYRRRKKDADCFMRTDFEDPEPIIEDCECSDADFECDFNFQRDPDDDTKCLKVGPIAKPDGVCDSDPEATFMGSSGWRLIPGNTCKRGDTEQKDDPVERQCSEVISAPHGPGSGEIEKTPFTFDTDLPEMQKIYLGASASGDDEVVIARPIESRGNGLARLGKVWMSRDHGKKWEEILKNENIVNIFPHQHIEDVVYFTTDGKKVMYTVNRGQNFHSFDAPTKPGDTFPLSAHPDRRDWLIWVGESCDGAGPDACHLEASLSTDRGDNWRTILRYVERCEFTGSDAWNFRPKEQILCLAREEERNDAEWTVKTSNNFFIDEEEISYFKKGGVKNFATMSEFIVLAGEDPETSQLHAFASLDGKNFEQAQFPDSFHEDHDVKFTVLDSSARAINLFVQSEGAEDREYGSIVKSNSNGTSFVVSASEVNCDADTYVDFEKLPGIEGVTTINVVANAGSESDKTKKLQTKISHNAGHTWGYLPPPEKDANGDRYGCSSASGDETCALHIHHYTEREDKKKTFGTSTAVGLMMAVGNVGSALGDIDEADTFLTSDGGVTWKSVKKGRWTWQFGDQGSIIVLVQKATRNNPVKTDSVTYSLDEGNTWHEYRFDDNEVTVLDITTLRSGISRNFLLWCKSPAGKLFSVNLDFTGFADEDCKDTEGDDSDYYLWKPKHPLQDNDCLFGHEATYLRKKTDRKCYNKKNLKHLKNFKNCACSREDYECAFNYQLDSHGQCSLVPAHEPLTGQEWCDQNPNATSWFEPTGYRRIPLSTCKGGKELDKTSTEHPCAGYEDEFEERHRTSGVAIFFAVVIPVALAGAIGWYVYRNWSSKFGQIRLGEQSATFDSDQPWIKYPVIAVSAVVAVGASLPLVVTAIWRSLTGVYEGIGPSRDRSWFSSGPRRFTTRDSFARGRPDYSMVDEDEGELLGEDSDEEV